jgi:hypothetical protein
MILSQKHFNKFLSLNHREMPKMMMFLLVQIQK